MIARIVSWPDQLSAYFLRHSDFWRMVFWRVLIVIVAFTLVRYTKKAETPSRVGTLTQTAFLRWRGQIQDLERNIDIYQKHEYPNPPIMAFILWPLTELPPVTGGVSWFLLKLIMAEWMFVWVFRLVAGDGRPLSGPARVMATLLALHPIFGDLTHGNVNIYIAFLVLCTLELLRRRWDWLAGVVLALAIACKITPALFLPFFAWKMLRNMLWPTGTSAIAAAWHGGGKVILGTLVGLSLWWAIVPTAVFAVRAAQENNQPLTTAWQQNQELLHSWYQQMVYPFLVEGKVTTIHINQSIPGLVYRLLTDMPSDLEYDEETGKPIPSEFHNLVSWKPETAAWIVHGFQLGFVMIILLYCRNSWSQHSQSRQGLAISAEYAIIILGMLLFSERTWKHHGTTIILPMTVIVGFWSWPKVKASQQFLLILSLVLCNLLTLIPSLLGGDSQDLALTYGSHCIIYCCLLATCVYILRSCNRGSSDWPHTTP